MPSNSVNPNNNEFKQEDILQLWYEATGEKFGKVNLATNDDVSNAKLAGKAEYIKLAGQKVIPIVHTTPIMLGSNQNLHIVNYANTHYFDLSNPQLGTQNHTNYKALKADLENKLDGDKTLVLFAGNLIGKEWKIGNLNNASINQNNKILFWGLKIRLEQLVKDIIYVAEHGANQVILMNGREEHIAKQSLNKDVMQEVVLEKFNRLLFRYVVKKVNEDLSIKRSQVLVEYVPGVKKVFNIIKKNTDRPNTYYTMLVETNLSSKSTTLKGNYNASKKQHGDAVSADVTLIESENVAGTVDDDNNVLFLTGQVDTYGLKGNLPIRQRGFQETDIVSMVKPVTKYAVRVDNPEDIVYELEKAVTVAFQGNPGPVLLDLPADVQRAEIEISQCKHYILEKQETIDYHEMVKKLNEKLSYSVRPCLLIGNGVKRAFSVDLLKEIIHKAHIPAVFSMPAFDTLPFF